MGTGRGDTTIEMARSAVALASAVVMTERTGECKREEYERLLSRVQVRAL
jgi:fructose-1-phosphate kinase PfkB-like protein